MNLNQIERDILRLSKEHKFNEVERIQADLVQRMSKLDYFIRRFVEEEEFDIAHNDIKTRFYNSRCAEYSDINRLLRVIKAYRT